MGYWYGKRRMKVRTVSEIETDIENIESRRKNYDLWRARNALYEERVKLHCTPIRVKISGIYKSEENYKKIFGIIRSTTLTSDAQRRVHQLEAELAEANKLALREAPLLETPQRTFLPEILEKYKKELAQAIFREKKIEKQRTAKARLAQADGKSRDEALKVKIKLQKNHSCPYCGNDLGLQPHADHIYPIARGGLSTRSNMVYVCATCNLNKKDKTLKMYIDEYKLNRDEIEARLTELGKEF